MARKTGDQRMFVCVEQFFAEVDGVPTKIKRGELVAEGHPLMRGREVFFKPSDMYREVEAATAAPGERRPAGVKPSAHTRKKA